MKDQITLTDVEYGNRKKTTKREEFLNKMEEIIPWKAWVEMIRPYYPKGEHGRPVRGIETMLRMYLMQTWFNLSDEGTEDARSEKAVGFFRQEVLCLGDFSNRHSGRAGTGTKLPRFEREWTYK